MELERALEGSYHSWVSGVLIKNENFFDFRDKEIVDILSGTVDSSNLVNLKTRDRSGVKRSNTNNTNITETPTSFNKFRPSEKLLGSI